MNFEASHGKARTTMPRASDVGELPEPPSPTVGRTAHGHFAAGNKQSGEALGWARAQRKVLAVHVGDAAAKICARDAWSMYCALLREMPVKSAAVKSTLGLHSRHMALAAYYSTEASRAGLLTDRGIKLMAEATKHGERAERLLVTSFAAAKAGAKMAKAGRKPLDVYAAAEEETRARLEPLRAASAGVELPRPVAPEAPIPAELPAIPDGDEDGT